MPASPLGTGLETIGAALDAARRARAAKAGLGAEIEHVEHVEVVADVDLAWTDEPASARDSQARPAAPAAAATTESLPPPTQPVPLCLVCLARPPSAVLLPCCHLVLCELCAPLLLLRARQASPPVGADTGLPRLPDLDGRGRLRPSSPSSPYSPPERPERPELPDTDAPPRTPYVLALSRALAGPAGRRAAAAAGAGYLPAARGTAGAEWRGADVLALLGCEAGAPGGLGTPQRADEVAGAEHAPAPHAPARGLAAAPEDGGRLAPSLAGREAGRCLVCRAGVGAWLRVYT